MGRYFPVEFISANLSFIFLFFYSRLFNILVNDCGSCHYDKKSFLIVLFEVLFDLIFQIFYKMRFIVFRAVIIFMGPRQSLIFLTIEFVFFNILFVKQT